VVVIWQERLLQMKRNLPSMSSLTNQEMGFDDNADMAAAGAIGDVKGKQAKQKAATKKQRWVRWQLVVCCSQCFFMMIHITMTDWHLCHTAGSSLALVTCKGKKR